MLKLVNMSKIFKYKKTKVKALDTISLQIAQNEMIAIMGPSGSGKSTLLNVVGGLFRQSSGEYLFNNEAIPDDEAERAEFRSEHVGFILQHFALIKNRNILYNIALPLKYKDVEKKERKKRALAVAESLGISNKLDMYPHMLSGGECQRAAIARAIISNPKVILADEPTGSLDDKNKYQVLDILKRLNNEGVTMIIATHDHTVAQMCDRTIKLDNGEIVG